MKPTLWLQWDLKETQARALYDDQRDCAPKSIRFPPPPPLPDCNGDTNGTCGVLPCWPERHAVCSASRNCICPAGTCAKNGICVDRGVPLRASPPTDQHPAPGSAATAAGT